MAREAQMARGAEFRGYGPMTVAAMGVLAMLAACAQALWLPDPASDVATYLALPAVLMASDLVATVPRRTARQIAAVAEIEITPLAIDLSVPVSMAWHRRATSEPAQVWFRSLLIEAARD